jgi:hypothetical protein
VRAVEEREERRDVIRRRRIVVVRASSRGRGAGPDADARAGVVSG